MTGPTSRATGGMLLAEALLTIGLGEGLSSAGVEFFLLLNCAAERPRTKHTKTLVDDDGTQVEISIVVRPVEGDAAGGAQ